MTPEEQQMLLETRNAVLENTKILQEMQKSTRRSRILQYCYWAFIIFGSIAAVYLGQLYVDTINAATSIGSGTTQSAAAGGTGVMSNLNSLEQELKQISQ